MPACKVCGHWFVKIKPQEELCDKCESALYRLSDYVAPVVHGRWISKNPHGYEWTFVCSNCGYVDGYPFNDRHNYCPNCGAKMDGGNQNV